MRRHGRPSRSAKNILRNDSCEFIRRSAAAFDLRHILRLPELHAIPDAKAFGADWGGGKAGLIDIPVQSEQPIRRTRIEHFIKSQPDSAVCSTPVLDSNTGQTVTREGLRVRPGKGFDVFLVV